MRQLVDTFAVGVPKGQPRPRAFARGGKARVYDPGTAEAWKGAVALAVGAREPVHGPVSVDLLFLLPRPKAHFRANGTVKPGAPGWHVAKPDLDNAIKSTTDALTTMGVWYDDAQIARLSAGKHYAESRWGCQIRVWALDDAENGGG